MRNAASFIASQNDSSEAGILYTAFRRGNQDVVTALDAGSGKTLWEFAYDNPFKNSYSEKVGPGPYAMPQVVGDRLFTASGTGKIHALDKKTGKLIGEDDAAIGHDDAGVMLGIEEFGGKPGLKGKRAEDFTDPSLIKELESQGFFTTLYRQPAEHGKYGD